LPRAGQPPKPLPRAGASLAAGFWQRLIEATDAAGTAVVTRAQAERDYEVVLDPETYEKLKVGR